MKFIEEIDKHIVDATRVGQLEEILEELLSGKYSVWTDGSLYFTKQQVDRIKGLKIEIYPNEHPPPHFHVRGGGINASFSIVDCKHLEGEISNRNKSIIEWWHERSKDLLVNKWNETRPSDCQVGPIKTDT